MPRLKNSVPKLRKKKKGKRIYAVVTLSGKDVYLGSYGTKSSQREYDRVVAEWLAAGRLHQQESENQFVPITDLCVQYILDARRRYPENSGEFGNARRTIREFRSVYGKTNAFEFGPLKFKAFRQRLIDQKLRRKTINHYMIHVIRLFAMAAENELRYTKVSKRSKS